jgi:hypothetical protein
MALLQRVGELPGNYQVGELPKIITTFRPALPSSLLGQEGQTKPPFNRTNTILSIKVNTILVVFGVVIASKIIELLVK